MSENFFAMMSRMKYIERWALMRNSYAENISEHSLETAMLAHALAVIGNRRLGKHYDAEKAALIAIYHDSTEIITGDMPTPVKYCNRRLQGAFKEVEEHAARQLLAMIPEDLREDYESIFFAKEGEEDVWKLVKAIEEAKAGNTEFTSAKESIENALMSMNLEEVRIFRDTFMAGYYKNLDELQRRDNESSYKD